MALHIFPNWKINYYLDNKTEIPLELVNKLFFTSIPIVRRCRAGPYHLLYFCNLLSNDAREVYNSILDLQEINWISTLIFHNYFKLKKNVLQLKIFSYSRQHKKFCTTHRTTADYNLLCTCHSILKT